MVEDALRGNITSTGWVTSQQTSEELGLNHRKHPSIIHVFPDVVGWPITLMAVWLNIISKWIYLGSLGSVLCKKIVSVDLVFIHVFICCETVNQEGDPNQSTNLKRDYVLLNCHYSLLHWWILNEKRLPAVPYSELCVRHAEILTTVGIYFLFKLPEKLLFSQGCNWIQQYSFGPEKYTGSNVFGKLRKCVELLKTQVSLQGKKTKNKSMHPTRSRLPPVSGMSQCVPWEGGAGRNTRLVTDHFLSCS